MMRAPWLALCALCACTSKLDVLVAPDAGALPNDPGLRVGRRIAAFEHSCFADASGLYCWGANDSGQLGVGDTTRRSTPTRVPGMDAVREVCAGDQHTCALLGDDSLYCWGQNANGELGTGTHASSPTPTRVAGDYARVACGGRVTCAIDDARTLKCWGDNAESMVQPFRPPDVVLTPTKVLADAGFNQVSVGQGHVCAIDLMSRMWCWGRNTEQQLGLDRADVQVRTPTPIEGLTFRRVSVGQQHGCGVLLENTLRCWGGPDEGKLGIEPLDTAPVPTPVQPGTNGFYDVATSWFHTCALRGDGELTCFGRNDEGQLGLGDEQQRNLPSVVGEDWTEVAVGRFHTCARKDGAPYCWGANDVGQLGLGDNERRNEPTLVTIE